MSISRIFKRGLLGLLTILAMAIVASWVGSWVFMDDDAPWSKQTQELPFFAVGSTDSLVQIPTGQWAFRARVAGFENKNPRGNLILLHGFPETSVMWEPLIDKAAQSGYRVVAYDQRGYSSGARPSARSAYSGEHLSADVLAVADAVGFDEFSLIGHDWGAVVGWQTVFKAPERVEFFSALSVPHISAILASFEQKPELRNRSAYMAFYWLPWLPEWKLSAGNFQELRDFYQLHPRHHVDEYLALFREKGALTGALNWYRAALDGLVHAPEAITTPTLFIWGNQDKTTNALAVDLQQRFMSGPFDVVSLDGGHWIMATHSEIVIAEVMARIP